MRKQLTTLLAMTLMTSMTFAQENKSTTNMSIEKSDTYISSQGVRLAIVKPILDFEISSQL